MIEAIKPIDSQNIYSPDKKNKKDFSPVNNIKTELPADTVELSNKKNSVKKIGIGVTAAVVLAAAADFIFAKGKHVKRIFGAAKDSNGANDARQKAGEEAENIAEELEKAEEEARKAAEEVQKKAEADAKKAAEDAAGNAADGSEVPLEPLVSGPEGTSVKNPLLDFEKYTQPDFLTETIKDGTIYDLDGKKLREVIDAEEGVRIVKEFDEQGLLVKEHIYTPGKNFIHSKFDSKGNEICRKTINLFGEEIRSEEFIYNKKNKLIQEIDKGPFADTTTNYYNNSGRRIRKVHNFPYGEEITEYKRSLFSFKEIVSEYYKDEMIKKTVKAYCDDVLIRRETWAKPLDSSQPDVVIKDIFDNEGVLISSTEKSHFMRFAGIKDFFRLLLNLN